MGRWTSPSRNQRKSCNIGSPFSAMVSLPQSGATGLLRASRTSRWNSSRPRYATRHAASVEIPSSHRRAFRSRGFRARKAGAGGAPIVLVGEALELINGYVRPSLEDGPDGQALGNWIAVSVFQGRHFILRGCRCQAKSRELL